MVMSNKIDFPHIYKKGKILKFKSLDPQNEKTYLFSSSKPDIQKLVNHTNNLNQITARCWLKMAKLLSYFGLEKDISDPLSKKTSWNLFKTDLSSLIEEKDERYKFLLQKQLATFEVLEEINLKLRPDLVTELNLQESIKILDEKIEKTYVLLKQVIG
jgi:hypothetical protein